MPQLYQRGFARQRGKRYEICVRNLSTGEGGVRNVRDTLKQRDWNTIVDAAGEKEFGIEELLAEHVDGAAAPAFHAIRERKFPLTPGARKSLAIWMSAQLSRGRVPRVNLSEFISESSRLMVKAAAVHYTDEKWLEVLGRIPDDDERQRLLDNEKHFDVRPTNAMLLHALLGSITEVAELIAKRTWTLVELDEPCLFTSDYPLVHITPFPDSMGYGVITAERLYLPITPSLALVLSHPWTSWPEARVSGTRLLAERLNWATLVHPNSSELLCHPDVEHHALPGLSVLQSGKYWPWGADPESEPPARLEVGTNRVAAASA